jgi:hypothetical protein
VKIVLECGRYDVEVEVHDWMNDGPWTTLLYVWEEDWNFEPANVVGIEFPWGWRPVKEAILGGGCRFGDDADGRDSLVFELYHPPVTLDEVLA